MNVGYGIKKKNFEKLFERAIYSMKKKSFSFQFWFIDWKSKYAILKPKYKKFFPTTTSEKYIPGKQCPKLQEFVVWLG